MSVVIWYDFAFTFVVVVESLADVPRRHCHRPRQLLRTASLSMQKKSLEVNFEIVESYGETNGELEDGRMVKSRMKTRWKSVSIYIDISHVHWQPESIEGTGLRLPSLFLDDDDDDFSRSPY